MERDFLRYLPLEIAMNILLRLPFKIIGTCKCVCKSWLDLIESDYFGQSAAPALAVTIPVKEKSPIWPKFEPCSQWINVLKLEDNHDPITKFELPRASAIHGSVNGLLLLKNIYRENLYVCNPITREFVDLDERIPCCHQIGDCFGFGVSKVSGKYKVVYHNTKYGFHVYTLETGSSWRPAEVVAPLFDCFYHSIGALCSGNLHWLVSWEIPYVCCFDLETERFSTFSAPATSTKHSRIAQKLYTLGDRLCFLDSVECDNVIWLLKDYEQPEKCWSKVLLIKKEPYHSLYYVLMKGEDVYKLRKPVKVYRDGGMLILWDSNSFYYTNSIFFTPSLVSLKKNLGWQNVIS